MYEAISYLGNVRDEMFGYFHARLINRDLVDASRLQGTTNVRKVKLTFVWVSE